MKTTFKSCLLSGAILFLANAGNAAETTLAIDPVHSTLGFKVRHLFSNVEGHFTKFSGTVRVDPDNPENSSVACTIQTASVDTGVEKRDSHLRTPDFFDAAKFPTMTFKSTKVTKLGPDTADVAGDFTLHGVTKQIVLHVKFLGKGKGMTGGLTTGWEATTAIKRSEYGLTWNKVIEGASVVADDVDIDLQVAADEPPKK